jgi:hypothetical protein
MAKITSQCTGCNLSPDYEVSWAACNRGGNVYPIPLDAGVGPYMSPQVAMQYPSAGPCSLMPVAFQSKSDCDSYDPTACSNCVACTGQALGTVPPARPQMRRENYAIPSQLGGIVCCRSGPYNTLYNTWSVQKPYTL